MKTWNKPWIYKHLIISFFVHLIPTTSNPRVVIQILVKFIFNDYCSSSKTDGIYIFLQKTVDSTILNQFIYILWTTFQCLKGFLSVIATKTSNIYTHLTIILVFILVIHSPYLYKPWSKLLAKTPAKLFSEMYIRKRPYLSQIADNQ